MAQKSLSSIISKADKDLSSTPVLVEGLLRAVDHTKFDKLIRTKQVNKLFAKIEASALSVLLGKCDQSLLDPQLEDEGLAAARRMSIADAIVAVLRSRSIQKKWQPDEDSPEFRIFLMLLIHASFQSTSTIDGVQITPCPPISNGSRKVFATGLSSCITVILTHTKHPQAFFDSALKAVHALETKNGSGKIECLCSAIALSEIRKAQAYRTTSTNTEAGSLDGSLSAALDLLIDVTTIQAYTDDEDAVNLLTDVAECARDVKSSGQNEVSERVIEVLLTLISKPSVFGRKLVAQIFPRCTSSVTQAGLNALLKVCIGPWIMPISVSLTATGS